MDRSRLFGLCSTLWFRYAWLVLLLVIVVVLPPSINAQLCVQSDEKLPNNHKCDGKLHLLHEDRDKISEYCGHTVKDEKLDAPFLSNGRNAEPGEIPYMAAGIWGGRHRCA